MASAKRKSRSFVGLIVYALGVAFVIGAFTYGWSYYSLPLGERPLHVLHTALKPGGLWGHGFGVVGSVMILLLFLYSARKRKLWGLRWGATRRWLSVHIFFGVMGPLLVTLHSAMKFNGIVSIGYFSMAAVALSGIFGRYIYIQIPRTASGAELQLKDLEEQECELEREVAERYHINPATIERLNKLIVWSSTSSVNGLWTTFKSDILRLLVRPRTNRMAKQLLSELSEEDALDVLRLVRSKALLHRRIMYLATFKSLFHYWHVFHKPFAYVMVIVVMIHIGVTVLFGYRWIF